jgi:CDP-diacylglycerol--serine O-phosphatidyltransferase
VKKLKWIPSFITIVNLSCGVLAIANGDLFWSSILIISGGVFDLFDGLAARILDASSNFGKELDSLADIISFGIAPAYLYFLIKPGDEWYFYIPMLLIASGAALRLAKFNVEEGDHSYFLGMATPSSAFMIIGVLVGVYYNETWIVDWFAFPMVYFAFAIIIFILNLIPLKMFSVKSIKSHRISRYLFLVLMVFFIYAALSLPTMAILLTFILYIILSVIFHLSIR